MFCLCGSLPFDFLFYPEVVKIRIFVQLPTSTSGNKVFELKYEIQQLLDTTGRQLRIKTKNI